MTRIEALGIIKRHRDRLNIHIKQQPSDDPDAMAMRAVWEALAVALDYMDLPRGWLADAFTLDALDRVKWHPQIANLGGAGANWWIVLRDHRSYTAHSSRELIKKALELGLIPAPENINLETGAEVKPEPTDEDILAGALKAAQRTDKPPVPEPPAWEVYAVPGAAVTALRVMHKGVQLCHVTDAKLEVTPENVVLHLTVTLPPDSFAQLKGAEYNWQSARAAADARK